MRVKTTLKLKLSKGATIDKDGTTTVTRTVQVKGSDVKGLAGDSLRARIANVAAAQVIGDLVVNDGSSFEVVESAEKSAVVAKAKTPEKAKPKPKAATPPPAPKSKPKVKAKSRPAASV